MGFFNEFPHTRIYDGDLGWLIKIYKELVALYKSNNEYLNEIIQKIESMTEEQLQEWLDDGTLANMIASLGNITKFINTATEMIADETLVNGNYVITLGYSNKFDGGNASYIITNVVDENNFQLTLNNGLYATIIAGDTVKLSACGCDPTGNADCTAILENLLTKKYTTFIVDGKYKISSVNIINKNVRFLGDENLVATTLATLENTQKGFYITGNGFITNGISPVTFQDLVFAGTVNSTAIQLNSFKCKIINCSFHTFQYGITLGFTVPTNFCGENYIVRCNFMNCGIGIYGYNENQSDGFIQDCIASLGNQFMSGMFAGYIITNNHDYCLEASVIGYFNTLFNSNYIQQKDDGAIIFGNALGNQGLTFVGNQIEISSTTPSTNFGLIVVSNGAGNILISSNSVHGKNLTKINNMAFIDMQKSDTIITVEANTLNVCGALYLNPPQEAYQNGGTYYKNNVTVNGTLAQNNSENFCVKNGIFYFDFIISDITNANVFSLGAMQVPCQIRMYDMDGDYSNTIQYSGGFVNIPTYSAISRLRVTGSGLLPINYTETRQYRLS